MADTSTTTNAGPVVSLKRVFDLPYVPCQYKSLLTIAPCAFPTVYTHPDEPWKKSYCDEYLKDHLVTRLEHGYRNCRDIEELGRGYWIVDAPLKEFIDALVIPQIHKDLLFRDVGKWQKVHENSPVGEAYFPIDRFSP